MFLSSLTFRGHFPSEENLFKLGSAKCRSRPRASSMRPWSSVSTASLAKTTPIQDGREALCQNGQSRAQMQRGTRGLGKWINKSIVIAERNAHLHGNNKSMPRLSMSKGGNEGGD